MASAQRGPGGWSPLARVVIAAGGTAGHVVPALAVADQLRARGASVEFFGGQRAEARLVPEAGYPFHGLDLAGIDRKNPVKAARALVLALRGVARARRLLRRAGCDVVVGAGGYVAGTVGLAALSARIPLVLCEQDSHLGISNRLLAPGAKRVFLAFALDGKSAPKFEVTGRPVPADSQTADRTTARRRFEIQDQDNCVLIFGGSAGARSINEAAVAAFGAEAPGVVLHACGERDYEAMSARLRELGNPRHYKLHSYITPFSQALAAADLVVGRAGGSVFELAAAGVPAILVPYPYATADHQTKNARWMADAGAAVVIDDASLDPARLRREVSELLQQPQRLREMAAAGHGLARPEAAERVAEQTLALVAGPVAAGERR